MPNRARQRAHHGVARGGRRRARSSAGADAGMRPLQLARMRAAHASRGGGQQLLARLLRRPLRQRVVVGEDGRAGTHADLLVGRHHVAERRRCRRARCPRTAARRRAPPAVPSASDWRPATARIHSRAPPRSGRAAALRRRSGSRNSGAAQIACSRDEAQLRASAGRLDIDLHRCVRCRAMRQTRASVRSRRLQALRRDGARSSRCPRARSARCRPRHARLAVAAGEVVEAGPGRGLRVVRAVVVAAGVIHVPVQRRRRPVPAPAASRAW